MERRSFFGAIAAGIAWLCGVKPERKVVGEIMEADCCTCGTYCDFEPSSCDIRILSSGCSSNATITVYTSQD